ncbi:hypothetical protein ACIA5D_42635 [Actinoplanes sp. NPDC051513]|uniref:hypothetical protein n=1 Tax=Actinoplanes sp. NPDC051513 TaxID=3363908 RepID=UPI0037A1600D
MDSEPRVAVCVLRCEAAPYGIRVTMTETSDIGSGVAREHRLLRAGPILDQVRRFLAEAGVSE